ncbi:hypothetical protein OHB01_15095 [Microbispora hainanensis]|uniref:AAA family ATPase n=1 Tax=Microbispora hainanensis TaxID=568844 RepID=A0ABZ1SHU9_9ACTN|nr:hypothetical protein [Microbispora hainanensis]
MGVSKITVTMLGPSHSGKTTFMYGMYATLSAGIEGYFLNAKDPDKDLDLMDNWDLLCDEGQLPPPTADVPISYEFVFKHGVRSLVDIDWMDFRGGATVERAGAPESLSDVVKLRERLKESDSIYLVLDGRYVGEWIKDGAPATVTRGPMKVSHLSNHISRTVEERINAGLPAPSLVVLITKIDVLAEITGMPKKDAIFRAMDNLQNLVPIAFSEGVTTLICPVQLGDFGIGDHRKVDPAKLDVRYMHKPIIFSLLYDINCRIARDSRRLEELRARGQATEGELEQLRAGFWNGFFKRSQIAERIDGLGGIRAAVEEVSQELETARTRVDQLWKELNTLRIVEDGKIRENGKSR